MLTAESTMPGSKLHIGCGSVYFDGWINVDNNKNIRQAEAHWDVTRGMPVPDNSCELIYSEHFLEHLTAEEGTAFLKECRRALQKGGTIRIAMPSLDVLIEKSANGTWREQAWLEHPDHRHIATRAEMLNISFYRWGHKWLYDREELHRRLRDAGFSEIEDMAWGQSKNPDLRNRETREDSLLICEAWKEGW